MTGNFAFDNTYRRSLEGFHAPWQAATVPAPKLIHLNHALAAELGLDPDALASDAGAAIFAGNVVPPGAEPLAQAYAGHQFGGFVPQLGDGRALLLGEVIDRHGRRRDIQLKGSGRTPFSRGGDGKATLGPVLREYLLGEAMHALGIPTTRALAAVTTGEPVYRDQILPGAVLTRVASSHIRVGTFQFFAARGDTARVRQLADYTIARHYPQVAAAPNPYLAFLEAVVDGQAALIARWMLVGFIHGVMNTDNMAISGETIDYGPCAFMDRYHPLTVFSSIDRQGRYAYGNQPNIARWNLARLAETLLPLIDSDEKAAIAAAASAVNAFTDRYDAYWLDGMRAKLGLLVSTEPEDLGLANGFLTAMDEARVDYTLGFRLLSSTAPVDEAWAARWRRRLSGDESVVSMAARGEAMNRVNPLYIARNHQVEAALSAAVDQQNLLPFETLLEVLAHPFTERPGLETYTQPAPGGGDSYRTFCGT